jgi:hypothetical protein
VEAERDSGEADLGVRALDKGVGQDVLERGVDRRPMFD